MELIRSNLRRLRRILGRLLLGDFFSHLLKDFFTFAIANHGFKKALKISGRILVLCA